MSLIFKMAILLFVPRIFCKKQFLSVQFGTTSFHSTICSISKCWPGKNQPNTQFKTTEISVKLSTFFIQYTIKTFVKIHGNSMGFSFLSGNILPV